jgi:hypothetical protein
MHEVRRIHEQNLSFALTCLLQQGFQLLVEKLLLFLNVFLQRGFWGEWEWRRPCVGLALSSAGTGGPEFVPDECR